MKRKVILGAALLREYVFVNLEEKNKFLNNLRGEYKVHEETVMDDGTVFLGISTSYNNGPLINITLESVENEN